MPPRTSEHIELSKLGEKGERAYRPLIALNLRLAYPDRTLLDGVSLTINQGEKIGLIGLNGSGKSTLLKILSGEVSPEAGTVSGGATVGFLPQNFDPDRERTVGEVITDGVRPLINGLAEYKTMSTRLAVNPTLLDDRDFADRYSRLESFLSANNGFFIEEKAREILKGLGVHRQDEDLLQATVGNFSGGEIIRIGLARALLSGPDALLLDEPTNHLDLRSRRWLGQFLKKWPSGLLVVSHDRHFLDQVTNQTVELAAGKLSAYGGNYSFYLEQKGLEEEARQRKETRMVREVRKAGKEKERLQERLAHSARRDLSQKPEDNDRFRAHYFKERAEKSAGGRRTKADRKAGELQKQLKEVKQKKPRRITPALEESEAHQRKLIIMARNLSCGYKGRTILSEINLTVFKGDRLAIFGDNGSGKSTLLKGLIGAPEVIISGERMTAEGLKLVYLDQNYALVDRKASVLDNLSGTTPQLSPQERRNHLARFLFSSTQEVQKIAGRLSGGEIARLSLAMVTASPIDLLVMDEPTNNLDIPTIEEIEIALADFEGAILIVSHDVVLLRNIGVNKAFYIKDGRLSQLKTSPLDEEEFLDELIGGGE